MELLLRQINYGVAEREMLRALMSRLSHKALNKLLAINGVEYLDKALEDGKDIIFIGSHINSVAHFLLIQKLRAIVYDAQVTFPSKNSPLDQSKFGHWLNKVTGR
jgi:lauroyl/myristoyl acyltransferase